MVLTYNTLQWDNSMCTHQAHMAHLVKKSTFENAPQLKIKYHMCLVCAPTKNSKYYIRPSNIDSEHAKKKKFSYWWKKVTDPKKSDKFRYKLFPLHHGKQAQPTLNPSHKILVKNNTFENAPQLKLKYHVCLVCAPTKNSF